MSKLGYDRLVLLLTAVLTAQLLSVSEITSYSNLDVRISQKTITVSAGDSATVQVIYENIGDTNYSLSLYIYDEGSNRSSCRPVLIYEGKKYTTAVEEKIFFGSMDLPIGQSKKIDITFEVYPNVTSGDYKMRIGGYYEEVGNSHVGSEVEFTLIVPCGPEDIPSIPHLNSPQDHAQNVSLRPDFIWSLVDNAESYLVHISTTRSFIPLIESKKVNGTSFVSDSDLKENTEYYWRVRAENDCDVSEWSEIRDFKTEVLSPTSPEFILHEFSYIIILVLLVAGICVSILERKRIISSRVQRFSELKPLIKLKYLSFLICSVSTAVFLCGDLNILHLSLFYFAPFGFLALISFLAYLIIVDLKNFFSTSVYSGKPEKPTIGFILKSFTFYLPRFLISTNGHYETNIIEKLFSSVGTHEIKYNTAGRIFTYASLSTFGYLWSIALAFVALFDVESTEFFHVVKKALEPPIGWEKVLTTLFFIFLTIIFFAVKESIFQYYGGKLISLKSQELKTQKKKFIDEVCRRLETVMNERINDVDKLRKEVELLEKRIDYIEQKIRKIEKEFEFHRSLKLAIFIPPLSIAISTGIAGIITWIIEILK